MKALWPVVWVYLLLTACTEISYKEPQPKGIKALDRMPPKLHGKYVLADSGKADEGFITVFEKGYRFEPSNPGEKMEEFVLSDSLVLKYYKGYYFVSYRKKYAWHLRVLQQQKNGDLFYLEMKTVPENDPERKAYLEKLALELPVVENQIDETTYFIIDPEPKKLIDLVKKGYFSEKTLLVKKE
jgi:hypothetical protein